MKFQTDIELGERYQVKGTEIEGMATSIHFYQHSCERVTLEFIARDGKLEEYTFDSPRLVSVRTGVQATSPRPGGPGDGVRAASTQAGSPSR